jgi:hypothetical protein
MTRRKTLPASVETDLLTASRRRCCLCVFLNERDEVRKGQIAHLNHDPTDTRFENLVWFCLEHHDEYDGRTSQAKGITEGEVRRYRDRLYARFDSPVKALAIAASKAADTTVFSDFDLPPIELSGRIWRFPFWLVANEPKFFAYTVHNRADGICLLERIDLVDGRIVLAVIQTAGNPGRSITNAAEELCTQLFERFGLPPKNVVWLQHYDDDLYNPLEWQIVMFGQVPPGGPFADPKWVKVTPEMWRDFRLRPKRRLTKRYGHFNSKLKKLFPWPTEDSW